MIDEQLITIKITKIINIQGYINYIFILECDIFIITKIIYLFDHYIRTNHSTARENRYILCRRSLKLQLPINHKFLSLRTNVKKKSRRTKTCD